MKVVGEAAVRTPAEAIWAALTDPQILTRAIPGCERLAVRGSGVAEFMVTMTLPALSGTFAGQVSVAAQDPPNLLTLSTSGSGEQGTFSAEVTIRITPADDGSLISYDLNGVVGGPIGAIGTRLLASAARRLAADFFASIESSAYAAAQLAARTPAPPAPEPPAPEPPAPESPAPESPAPAAAPAPASVPASAPGVTLASAVPVASFAGPVTVGRAPAVPEPAVRGLAGTLTWTRGNARSDVRVAVLAGLALGLLGVIVGILLGRARVAGGPRPG